jgi:AbrB family looped-hinge helix DNA binding protein
MQQKGSFMKNQDRYMGSVKVGSKGQIVIPKEIREIFDINPGDCLFIMADKKRGIAMNKQSIMEKIANAIFATGKDPTSPHDSEDDLKGYANNIKNISKTGKSIIEGDDKDE